MTRFPLLKNIHMHSHVVYMAPLIRIYIYDRPVWFKDLNRMTTHNVLRQIIPINKERLDHDFVHGW